MKKRIIIYSLLVISLATLAYAAARFNFIKTSFNAGEFSSSIYGRTDLEKYNNGCITMKNFIPIPQGGATRRPGFEYIADAKNAGEKVRLIPFQFSDQQSYIVEVGTDYMRYYKDGGQIITSDASTALLLHMNGADASVTFTDDADTADRKTVTVNGDAQIDTAYKKFGTGSGLFDGTGDYLSIADHADWNFGADEFTIDFWVRFSAVSGTQSLFYTQNTDQVYITHTAPSTLQVNIINGADTMLWNTTWTPAVDTWYHFALIRGWGGVTDDWAITVNGSSINTTTDTVVAPDVAAAVYIGGNAESTAYTMYGWLDEVRVSKDVARWTANFTPPTREYPLDTDDGAIYEDTSTGFLESELDTLKYAQSYDTMYIVHKDQTPAKLTRADHDDWTLARVSFTATPAEWSATNGWPRAVAFHQDRLVLAGSPGYPPRFWFSQTSDYENLTTGTDDDDGFSITLLSGSVDMIYWLESQRRLVAGSNSGEWWLSGDGNDLIITPTSKQAQNDTKHGSIEIQPINIGNTLLIAQTPGTKIREMSYDYDTDSYASNDITILADHILKGYSAKQMAYQQTPYQIVWVLRSDGTLFALTYMKEHQVVGWSEIETDGTIISIATIPGDPEDELWLAVERTINSTTKTYIERMKDFKFATLSDAFMVDSGLTYDGADTMTISGLDHLRGETVDVLADGLVESQIVLNNVLLLHMDGADAATTFTDDGNTVHTVTANGDAQIDTAQQKYGTASGLFDGTGDYLSIPDSADWNFGGDPFTIDFWVRPTSIGGSGYYFHPWTQYVDADNYITFWIFGGTIGEITAMDFLYNNGGSLDVNFHIGSLSLPEDTWYHIALIRGWGGNNDDWAICVDGVAIATMTDNTTLSDQAAEVYIGRWGTLYSDCHFDDLRVTKGKALWTANFTAPVIAASGENTITLDTSASLVHIGMPYNSDLQTMYVDIPLETGSSMFMKKRIPTANFRVRDSAGGKYGKDSSNLVDLMDDTPLYSGDLFNKSVNMGWARNASIYIRQDDPLPLTIDTMVMEVEVGN